jgi:hypothetical protein
LQGCKGVLCPILVGVGWVGERVGGWVWWRGMGRRGEGGWVMGAGAREVRSGARVIVVGNGAR